MNKGVFFHLSKGDCMFLKRILFVLLISVALFAFTQITACGSDPEEVVEKTYSLDNAMGDWQGVSRTVAGVESPLVAQVIAYDEGEYKVNFLEKFDTREPAIVVLEGIRQNGKINLSGLSRRGVRWQGTIEDTDFHGQFSGNANGSYRLQKIVRLPSSLDIRPPDNAIVLFDGNHFNNWEQQRDPLGYINLAKHVTGENCVVYLKADIWSDHTQRVVLELGSNDGIKAWVNEEIIATNNVSRGATPGQERETVTLLEGWNSIMLAITNEAGSWGAFARFVDNDGNAVETISEIDETVREGKSRKSLEENDNFLTIWRVNGPYKKEGLKAKDLFEISFAPENDIQHTVAWENIDFKKSDNSVRWKITDGAMEVVPGSGSLVSKQKFTDYLLHIEFRSPFMPNETEQGRGNSGVYNQGRYEVQVLDSYGLEGEDNECGGIYKIARPLVNMCAPPMQWQTYDIYFTAARYDSSAATMENARFTVIHNDIVIHDNLEIPGPTGGAMDGLDQPGPLMLQDHGDRVQFRNIWLIETTESEPDSLILY
jgi:hypothetical protein